MPLYKVPGPDGLIYNIEAPAGASQQSLMSAIRSYQRQQEFDAAQQERNRKIAELMSTPPQTTVGGNIKEFFKGVAPGALGLAKTAGTGIAALLPESRNFCSQRA